MLGNCSRCELRVMRKFMTHRCEDGLVKLVRSLKSENEKLKEQVKKREDKFKLKEEQLIQKYVKLESKLSSVREILDRDDE